MYYYKHGNQIIPLHSLRLTDICLAVIIHELKHCDDLKSRLDALKEISSDLYNTIIDSPELIWHRGICRAICSGTATASETMHGMNGNADVAVYSASNNYKITRISTAETINTVVEPANTTLVFAGFTHEGRCIVFYALNEHKPDVILYYLRAENYQKMHQLPTSWDIIDGISVKISGNIMFIVYTGLLIAWDFSSGIWKKLRQITYESFEQIDNIIWYRFTDHGSDEMTNSAFIRDQPWSPETVSGLMSMQWLHIYAELNPHWRSIEYKTADFSVSPDKTILTIPVYEDDQLKEIAICDWYSIIKRFTVESSDICWLTPDRLCVLGPKGSAGQMISLDSVSSLPSFMLQHKNSYCDIYSDIQGRYMLVSEAKQSFSNRICKVERFLFIHDLKTHDVRYVKGVISVSNLFDSCFALTGYVSQLKKGLDVSRSDMLPLIAPNSRFATAIRRLNGSDRRRTNLSDPIECFVLIVNLQSNQMCIHTYSGSSCVVIKSMPYLYLGGKIFDAKAVDLL